MKTQQPLLLAISGPSCSGKTTLSRLLRDALQPHALIIHQDDFYVPDSQIPFVTVPDGRSLQDWDCKEGVDFVAFEDMIRHVKSNGGKVKDGFESKEDLNDVGEVDVDWAKVETLKKRLAEHTGGRTVIIVDGFLMFAEGMESLMGLFDVKMLLTVDYATMKRRREARKGYVTLEGFWEDPDGYVDLIVWPNYVKDHSFLYREGDVDKGIDEDACEKLEIRCRPTEDMEDMTQCFQWAVEQLIEVMNGKE